MSWRWLVVLLALFVLSACSELHTQRFAATCNGGVTYFSAALIVRDSAGCVNAYNDQGVHIDKICGCERVAEQ